MKTARMTIEASRRERANAVTRQREKDERAAWVQRRRENHHRALETLAQTVDCETPGLVLWRQLRRIENPLHYNAERYCNGDIDSEQWEVIKNQYRNRLAKVFGGRVPTGVFINGDPRGHALKLDNEQMAIPAGMETDWGGYGILAAEIE
jgi:hypothetical protein